MEPILISILSGLVAGATAKAKDVASTAVSDAYNGLKSLLIHKLGNSGAVQSVEDDSDSESARAALAEALANKGLAKDAELAALAESMKQALAEAKAAAVLGAAGIDVEARCVPGSTSGVDGFLCPSYLNNQPGPRLKTQDVDRLNS